MTFLRRKRYRVNITSDTRSIEALTATEWTEVRAIVGAAVEKALSGFPEGKRTMAYLDDVQRLNAALTESATQTQARGGEGWRFSFTALPLAVTIHYR
ncbi:hypothetical protein [Streptomyces buecherae]|uniref:hypothetical protein n=1 Tax=Streptomyces buecherae TaxID=2763006 RepID=UPI003647526C